MLRKKGKYRYGDDIEDLRQEMLRFSKKTGYPATLFWEPVCPALGASDHSELGGKQFHINYSEEEGGASLNCGDCFKTYHLADSAEYDPGSFDCASGCFCEEDAEYGQVLVGAASYAGSDDLRWLYVGWRAPCCGLLGVYVDWKYDGSLSWREVLETWGQFGDES